MQNFNLLARHFFVDDIPSASTPSSRLRNLLESLQNGRPISSANLLYLEKQGLKALAQFAQNKSSFEEFADYARSEQSERQATAVRRREAEEAALRIKFEEIEKQQAIYWAQREAERLARESDPKYIAKMQSRTLRARYGIDFFIDPQDFPRLMTILQHVDHGKRLSEEDSIWLATAGCAYFSTELRCAFHQREAEYFVAEYTRKNDPWNAVNASAHYRKCELSSAANDLLNSIPTKQLKTAKLQSAFATTHGGVKRDMGCLDEALQLGSKAHSITPGDFRPCTLLGAVNYELGNFAEGHQWYTKAIERGATERDVDYDLKSILSRVNKVQRKAIKAFLIKEDPIRFKWVKSFS